MDSRSRGPDLFRVRSCLKPMLEQQYIPSSWLPLPSMTWLLQMQVAVPAHRKCPSDDAA
ncbi:hypothetical protein SLEP1_g26441 [Rubroshorea leprosula]|uniref:Uncharacterized protein n=1 Tax=Rubroshorea leprosula TaxID=152421 RepID=A0AAV5JWA9_9ROSI|nr:hypothetical protein SLEP1_g26441 [Rubroshorea leprosula]